ncbi:MAG: hypothetical protein LBP63_00525, partial [Prevotellaceae bacterium]|nr:hypothetical protein [Prevotellaceae bacterium]
MKNQSNAKHSNITKTRRGAKSEITVKQGKPRRPQGLSLLDVLNFIENANSLEFTVIHSTVQEA